MNGNATPICCTNAGSRLPTRATTGREMSDFDYGLRARAAGCSVWIAPGTIGTCASHPRRHPGEEPMGRELRRLWSIKEPSPGPWAVYTRRWSGRLWPVYWLSPMCTTESVWPSSARRWGARGVPCREPV
jgi:GT2 family glycosyltransferase